MPGGKGIRSSVDMKASRPGPGCEYLDSPLPSPLPPSALPCPFPLPDPLRPLPSCPLCPLPSCPLCPLPSCPLCLLPSCPLCLLPSYPLCLLPTPKPSVLTYSKTLCPHPPPAPCPALPQTLSGLRASGQLPRVSTLLSLGALAGVACGVLLWQVLAQNKKLQLQLRQKDRVRGRWEGWVRVRE